MTRDIITEADAANAIARDARLRQDGNHDFMVAVDGIGQHGGAPSQNTQADAWYQRLMKYIPGEAIGLYVALDKLVLTLSQSADQTAATDSGQPLNWTLIAWASAELLISLVFNVLYLKRIWKVQRLVSIVVSSIALIAYAYATGGVFTALHIAPPFAQVFVLIVTAAFLIFFQPPQPLNPGDALHLDPPEPAAP
jgi:hypothetical protein